ncbi:MAG: hypothetical protein AAFQ99_07230, partial [Pseudomonadota bacterium]
GTVRLAAVDPIPDLAPFWLIGHPAGQALRISREQCRAGRPSTSGQRLRHTCDTVGGNSGSPVIDADTRTAIALHHAGQLDQQINFAIPISRIAKHSSVITALLETAPNTNAAVNTNPPKAEPVAPVTTPVTGDVQREWGAIQNTSSCAMLDVFLEKHEGTLYGRYATARKEELACGVTTPPTTVDRCPNAVQQGTALAYSAQELLTASSRNTAARGGVNLLHCSRVSGKGSVSPEPNFSLSYVAAPSHDLRIRAEAACDTILLANLPDGSWALNDNTNGRNPELRFTNATGGRIDIWVGVSGSETCDATLILDSLNTGSSSNETAETTTSGACPTVTQRGYELQYSNADLNTEQSYTLTAGGEINMSDCLDVPGGGYLAEKPDFTLEYSGESNRDLRIQASATCDSTLLVNRPDGSWTFDDDTNSTDPEVRIANAGSGRYDIWVGTISSNTCSADFKLETFPTTSTSSSTSSSTGEVEVAKVDQSATATGCPDVQKWGDRLEYTSSSLNLARTHSVTANGLQRLSDCSGFDDVGFFATSPSVTLNYTEGNGKDLLIRAEASCDTVLLVNDASQKWFHDDDTNSRNPEVRIAGASDGYIDIWVGTHNSENC